MTTDTKAVARWDWDSEDMHEYPNGDYVLFTDHERVVVELERLAYNVETENEFLRYALAASRAEVEGLRTACSGSAYTLFLDAYYKACETSKPSDWHDAAMLAKQWEQRIDAAMEKGNV